MSLHTLSNMKKKLINIQTNGNVIPNIGKNFWFNFRQFYSSTSHYCLLFSIFYSKLSVLIYPCNIQQNEVHNELLNMILPLPK